MINYCVHTYSPSLSGCYSLGQYSFSYSSGLTLLIDIVLVVPRFLTFYSVPALATVRPAHNSRAISVLKVISVLCDVRHDPFEVWIFAVLRARPDAGN